MAVLRLRVRPGFEDLVFRFPYGRGQWLDRQDVNHTYINLGNQDLTPDQERFLSSPGILSWHIVKEVSEALSEARRWARELARRLDTYPDPAGVYADLQYAYWRRVAERLGATRAELADIDKVFLEEV